MRLLPRMMAFFMLVSLLASCSTMMAYEEQRQARRGTKVAASPKPVVTPGSGTLFQPTKPVAKVDEAAILANRSVKEAEKQLANSDPNKATGVAPGPTVPVLKTLLTDKLDIEAVSKTYAAYAQATSNLRVSLDAFGLKANIDGLRHLREAGDFWSLYLPRLRIRPNNMQITAGDVRNFYGVISDRGKQMMSDLVYINHFIDVQRTKKWVISTSSK